MKKVLLINQGNTENLGDIAIKNIAINLLKEFNCIVTFSGYAQSEKQQMEKLTLDKKGNLKKYIPNFFKWLLKYHWDIAKGFKKIKENNYDLVIIGGGQLLKANSVFVYCLFSWIFFLSKKKVPIYLVSVGMDKITNTIEKTIYKYCFKKIKNIYFREKNSIKIYNKVFKKTAKIIPDLVFAYSRYNKFFIQKKNYIMVMIYDYETLINHFKKNISKKEYYENWISLIKQNKKNLDIILTYTAIEDKKETYEFYNYILKNTNLQCTIKNTDSLEKFTLLLEKTELVISGRMHGMILAYNYDCKILSYLVSDKILFFKEEYLDKKIIKQDLENEIINKLKEILY